MEDLLKAFNAEVTATDAEIKEWGTLEGATFAASNLR